MYNRGRGGRCGGLGRGCYFVVVFVVCFVVVWVKVFVDVIVVRVIRRVVLLVSGIRLVNFVERG